jgi:hypothetical protein
MTMTMASKRSKSSPSSRADRGAMADGSATDADGAAADVGADFDDSLLLDDGAAIGCSSLSAHERAVVPKPADSRKRAGMEPEEFGPENGPFLEREGTAIVGEN